jgi:hypothetical protein
MIKLEFTDEDKKLLSYGRFNYPHPKSAAKDGSSMAKK